MSHTLLLGVLTQLQEGPAAFTTAAKTPWKFAERCQLTTYVPS
ncbi:hypothetical protein [Streptomyces parvus]